jgi:dipeptidyl aminopeptidase/acylaminoacyl peptidase
MSVKVVSPYGSWASPITADIIVEGGLSFSEIRVDGDDVYWLEGRPHEDGRSVVVRRSLSGHESDQLPAEFNARTGVHEYGGGVYAVGSGAIYFVNWEDQRIYRVVENESPQALTGTPEIARSDRYADLTINANRDWLCCVRERHRTKSEPSNDLVAVSVTEPGLLKILTSGHDFYSSPRLSPDSSKICWLSWDHPSMPWDGCVLWVAEFNGDGLLSNERRIAGSQTESIAQPEWSPDGDLFFVSDISGWWNLSVWDGHSTRAFLEEESDHAEAAWQFGNSTYGFLNDDSLVLRTGLDNPVTLRRFERGGRELPGLGSEDSTVRYVTTVDQRVFYVGASPISLPEIVSLDSVTGTRSVLKKSSDLELDPDSISKPCALTFPTTDNAEAHAFYYPPRNSQVEASDTEKPPLLVITHGGPTGAAGSDLSLRVQFWTSRGFAVVDVNYRGSTGHGRAYRDALKGMWGVYDTADCIAAADFLVEQGLADIDRLVIRGGSAGGYTAINALTFYDRFAAGATYYGIADLQALIHDTHKFESRYLDSLIGPYPEAGQLYHDRSAIHFTERLSCPMIIFQGLEDTIVPPSQAELMSTALREKGIPFSYVSFDGEQHGFRQAKNIKRSLEAELYFYGRVMGFDPADQIESVEIENFDRLPSGA